VSFFSGGTARDRRFSPFFFQSGLSTAEALVPEPIESNLAFDRRSAYDITKPAKPSLPDADT
jgi:hypothetical protein